MQNDWTKPAAVAIPKGGFFEDKVEQGRYGPIFPKTPACYGFSILAKIKPGTEPNFRWCLTGVARLDGIATPSRSKYDPSGPPPSLASAVGSPCAGCPAAASAPASRSCSCTS